MSGRATDAVWDSSKLDRSHRSFLLLLAIAARAGRDGVAWPGRGELLSRLDTSDRHLRRCTAVAVDGGELEVREALDGRVVYRLTLPGLDEIDVAKLTDHGLKLAEPFRQALADACVRTAAQPTRTPRSGSADARVRPTRARASSRTLGEPSASGGSAPGGSTAQDLVSFYVNENRRRGVEPLSRLVGHIGREAKQLLADGATADEICAGLRVLVSKGLHPSTLASCVQEQRLRSSRTRGGGDGRFAAYDAGL